MKYKIKDTDIFLNGKLIPENSEAELTGDQIRGLEQFLIPVEEAINPEFISGSSSKTEAELIQESVTQNEKQSKKNKGNKK